MARKKWDLQKTTILIRGDEKLCAGCKTWKNKKKNFYVKKKGVTDSYCKDCRREINRKYYLKLKWGE